MLCTVRRKGSDFGLMLLLLLEHRGTIRVDDLAHLLLVLGLASVLITRPPLPWARIIRLAMLCVVAGLVVGWCWATAVVERCGCW